MYCRYGELESNSRGDFMRCPKNCECDVVEDSSSESTWAYALIGVFLCSMLYVIYLLVDALAMFNNLMS
jgi:hypothetical protein